MGEDALSSWQHHTHSGPLILRLGRLCLVGRAGGEAGSFLGAGLLLALTLTQPKNVEAKAPGGLALNHKRVSAARTENPRPT